MPDEELNRTLGQSYPANSHKSKKVDPKEKPKLEKVVTGVVVERKKPLGRRIAETFTGDDMQSVGGYILFDVIIPAAKSMIADAITEGVQRKLFGSEYRGTGGIRKPGYTSYNRVSTTASATRADIDRPGGRNVMSTRDRATHNFDNIVLETRGEADGVLDRLAETIAAYDQATVSDLYDLVGITGEFTDEKWGWTSMEGASIRPVRGGYLLMLPPTKSIV